MTPSPPLDLRRILLRAVSGGTLVQLAGALLGFLVGIQLARGLGVDGYGTYGSALAVAGLGSAVASGGVQLLATRDTAVFRARGDTGGMRRLLIWSLRHVLLLLLPVSAVAAAVLWQLTELGPLGVVAGTALVWLLALVTVLGSFLRGMGAVLLGMALDATIRPAVYSALLFTAALFGATLSPTLAMALTALALCIALATGLPRLREVWRAAPAPIPADEARRWWRASMTMRVTTVLRMAEATLPLLLVGALASMTEAGAFRVATSITVLAGMVGSVIHLAMPPVFAQLEARGEADRMRKLAAASAMIMTLPAAALLLLSLAFGRWAIGAVFGADFVLAATPTSILLASTVAVAFGGVSQVLLQTRHLERHVNIAFGLSLAVTVPLAAALAPGYGATGAAVAVATGLLVRTVTLSALCHRLTGLDPTMLGAVRAFRATSSQRKAAP